MPDGDLARRFLHVNLNCESMDATERLYGGQLGLAVRMRTDPSAPIDGSILGLDGETYCATAFLYDVSGARAGCALEAIEYHSPAIKPDRDTNPIRPGIRATSMAVAGLARTVSALRDAGVTVGDPVDGLISGTKSVLVLDGDGAVIELTEGAATGTTFGGIRIAAKDAVAAAEFLTAIGFTVVHPPKRMSVTGEQLAPGGALDPVDCLVARFALPEDGHRFGLTVVQHPGTADLDPVPWGGNLQGLYRCALRVDNVEKALTRVPDFVEIKGEPVWCPMPGTNIDGLYIAFLRSPEGVVFEFVERQLSHFAR